jgi:8-oxo-dGTP diphosphatase
MPPGPKSVIAVAAGVLDDADGRVLITQRRAGSHAAGRWEFPGGKLRAGETPGQGLARELEEELGILDQHADPLIAYRHEYDRRIVDLHVWRVLRYRGQPSGREGQPLRWIEVADLLSCGLLPADRPIVDLLLAEPRRPRELP